MCTVRTGNTQSYMLSMWFMKSAMIGVLVLLLFYGAEYANCTTVPQNSTDKLSLLDFRREITSDPTGFFRSWNTSVDYCSWNGIICSRTHSGRVTELNLRNQSLEGRISPSLGNLTFLRILDLSSNSFFGQLPLLSRLVRLQDLVLNNNRLQGFPPDALINCSNLHSLSLSSNLLAGPIPPSIGFLFNLKYLYLDFNNFTGGIPSSLLNISKLEELLLTSNMLDEPIPPNIGSLFNLKYLYLNGNSFSGGIPSSLLNISKLEELVLTSNLFSGPIPPSMGLLFNLEYLYLDGNSFTGGFPSSVLNISKLVKLVLSSNMLDGPIPPNIGSLFNLSLLYLDTNNFTGAIPSSLRNITQLEELLLSDNQLQGTIPDELGQLSNISRLLLGGNRLSGRIPTTILNLPSLGILDVSVNFLRMQLPSNIGNTLPNLIALVLHNNMFYGRIPASLGNASYLEVLDFTSNNFTGHVPSSLGNLTMLVWLKLEQNNLQAKDTDGWEFLDALGQCTSLQYLLLSDNQLLGAIPNSVGKLSNSSLQYLRLGKNNLSGAVPESIGNLNGLNELGLDQNNLIGPIGSWVGNLNNLVKLSISDNNFSGPIPSSICSFTQLTHLYLQSNKFEGPIPPSLGKLQHLLELNVSYNNLLGPIPKELFSLTSSLTKCALSYNSLDGPIPPEVSNLQQLIELDLSSNKLAGEIPSTLGECRLLHILQMDGNFLTGNISPLISLTSLTILNLSHNMLSGLIPMELGNMSSLIELDLSYNDLQGQVPRDGIFRNASAVSVVGNRRLCGGLLDLHLRPCPVASRRKAVQYYLIRVLIPIFGIMSLLMLVYFVLTEKRTAQQPSLSPLGDQFPIVSYDDLVQATQNFSESNMIGRGGYGSVYRGKLMENKMEVAIKVLDIDMRGAEKSFLSECEALRNTRHRNLVPIITACSTVDINGNVFKALIYEFMPNENLDTWLHQEVNGKIRKPLDLNQRTCLAVNIADALDYLHNESGKTIIHCDVKPSNILLDDDMNACLGDFGIAKFYLDSRATSPGDLKTVSSTGVKGTIGYIPPEYARGGYASTYGDVYSFGIVLLEMLTGKRPTDHLFVDELNIVNFVERSFPDKILDVIDGPLQDDVKSAQRSMVTENEAYQCLLSLLQVALSCTREIPAERMTMKDAASRIRSIKTMYAEGEQKHTLNLNHQYTVPMLATEHRS